MEAVRGATGFGLDRESPHQGQHRRQPIEASWSLTSNAFCVAAALVFGREEYEIMKRIGAERSEPILDDIFRQPATWSSLSLKCVRHLKRKRPGV